MNKTGDILVGYCQFNKSPSKQLFSFAKGTRFKKMKKRWDN